MPWSIRDFRNLICNGWNSISKCTSMKSRRPFSKDSYDFLVKSIRTTVQWGYRYRNFAFNFKLKIIYGFFKASLRLLHWLLACFTHAESRFLMWIRQMNRDCHSKLRFVTSCIVTDLGLTASLYQSYLSLFQFRSIHWIVSRIIPEL